MPEVVCYVKNDRQPGFAIPYTLEGVEKRYYPDFVARMGDGQGPLDLLSVIVEVTGQKKEDKEAKVATARALWVPAVNNHGGLGRWAFVEVTDPYNAQTQIRLGLQSNAPVAS
jgi:type III restriction enzyme